MEPKTQSIVASFAPTWVCGDFSLNDCQNCLFLFFLFLFLTSSLLSTLLSLSLSLLSLFRYPHIAGTRYYDSSAAYPLPSDIVKSEDALPPPLLPLCVSLFLFGFLFWISFLDFFFWNFLTRSLFYFFFLSLSLFSLSGLMLISPYSSVAYVLVMFFVFYVHSWMIRNFYFYQVMSPC